MSRTTARIATVALLLGGLAAPVMADPVAAPQAPAQAAPMARQPAAAEVRVAYDRADALSRQIFWSDQADIDPMDPVAGVKAAQALRELGRFDQAAEMASKAGGRARPHRSRPGLLWHRRPGGRTRGPTRRLARLVTAGHGL